MKQLKILLVAAVSCALFACGGDGTGYYPIPVSGAAINLDGGDGFSNITSAGGHGGALLINSYTDVKILKSGTVKVGFSIPSYAYSFGDVKVTVTTNTDVLLDPEVDPGVGVLYMRSADSLLYVGDGNSDTDVQVTGLSVAARTTLRFPTNITGEGDTSGVYIPYAVVIDGTVTTIAESMFLNLESGSFLQVGTTGTITSSGRTAGASAGGLFIASYGVAINKGTIESNGATGGGMAAEAIFAADSFAYNTGVICADGGDNTEGAGGFGGYAGFGSYDASVYTSGTVSANGGDGTGGAGGAGGLVAVAGYSEEIHRIIAGGIIQANGGNGIGANGNSGGLLQIYTNSGAILLNADISLVGGNSTGTGYYGGSGGILALSQSYDDDYGYGEQAPIEGIRIAGDINLSGGTGDAYGGSGGLFIINTDYAYENAPVPTQVEFVGYSSISMNGGNGVDGANAGTFQIYTEDAWTGDDYIAVPVGSIINKVPVSAKGGNGSLTGGHYGGLGGFIEFEAEGEFSIGTTVVLNSGKIDVSGGVGDYAGDAGGVYFFGHDKVTNSATITAVGGAGTTMGGNGAGGTMKETSISADGNEGGIEFYSTLDIVNSGRIIAGGGSGETGGNGANIVAMYAGKHTTNSGALSANGGAGTINGGNGGYIDLFSQYVPTSNSGKLNVAAGAGGTLATNGIIWIDWVDVTPGDGIL
jgi:hypothetical protein